MHTEETPIWLRETQAAFGPTNPRSNHFWLGAFPELSEMRLCEGDVSGIAFVEREIASRAYIRIERASSELAFTRLDMLAEEVIGKEKWNHGIEPNERGGFFGFIWPTKNVVAKPIGVFTFTVHPHKSLDDVDDEFAESPELIQAVSFDFKLAFVKEAFRGNGYGLYIGSAISHWLSDCKVTPPLCPDGGIKVYYHADFYSKGGEVVSALVTQTFRLMQELDDATRMTCAGTLLNSKRTQDTEPVTGIHD